MDADKRRSGFVGIASRNVATDEGHVQFVVGVIGVGDHAEISVARGEDGFGNATDVAFMLHAVANEVGDGQEFHAVLAAEFDELRDARHGAVVVHDFADHAGVIEAGQAREIDRRFGLSGADEDSAIAGAQGVDVSWAGEIFRMSVGIGGGEDGGGAVCGAGAGGGAAAGVYWFAEGGAEHGRVARSDGGEGQRIAALFGHGEADEAAAEFSHEVDGFGRDLFGGHGEIAFILAIFVVHQDDHASGADFVEGFFDGGEWRFAVGHWWLLPGFGVWLEYITSGAEA